MSRYVHVRVINVSPRTQALLLRLIDHLASFLVSSPPQEQASWVCQCDESLVARLEQDFKTTLQQQVGWPGHIFGSARMVVVDSLQTRVDVSCMSEQ